MSVDRVLRRIFGPKGDEATEEWRKLRNEELRALYCSPNIVRVIKSRRMRWAGHVARLEEGRVGYRDHGVPRKIRETKKDHNFVTKPEFSTSEHTVRCCVYQNIYNNLSFGYRNISML
jgi:hypothetical protein